MDKKLIGSIILLMLLLALFIFLLVKISASPSSSAPTPSPSPTPTPTPVQCPSSCGSGKCDQKNGVCVCDTGYRGVQCQIACPGKNRDCNGLGVCDDFGKCKCNSGYSGADCLLGLIDLQIFSVDDGGAVLHPLSPPFNPNTTQYTLTSIRGTESQWIIIAKAGSPINVNVCNRCGPSLWSTNGTISGQGTPNVTITNSGVFPSGFLMPIEISTDNSTQTYYFNMNG